MTIDDAVNTLKEYCKDRYGFMPSDFSGYYCGVTNDIQRREAEHNVSFLGHVKTKTVKSALNLEARMHDEGFCTGKQLCNAGDDTVYVYVSLVSTKN